MKPLAVVVSHPIQYQTPFFAYLAQSGLPVHVFFLSDIGLRHSYDAGFGRSHAWDLPMLDGYESTFLRNLWPFRVNSLRFFHLVNPSVLRALSPTSHSALLVFGYRSVSKLLAVGRAAAAGLPILYRSETNLLQFESPPCLPLRVRALGWALRALSAMCLSIGSLNDQFYSAIGVPVTNRVLVPYAVDTARFRRVRQESVHSARASLGIKAPGPVVLYSGKLVKWKEPMLLLEAFIKSAPSGSTLLYVGEGPERQALERAAFGLADRHVHFLGFLNQSAIPTAYRASDVLVLPSSTEPWGLVVNEAMSCGVPCVVSDRVGCAPDLVHDGLTGSIFKSGDVPSLAATLRSLLLDPVRLVSMGRSAASLIDGWGYKEGAAGVAEALRRVGADE